MHRANVGRKWNWVYRGTKKKHREKSPKGYLLSWPSFIGSTGIFNTIAVRLKIHYSVDTGPENRKTGLES